MKKAPLIWTNILVFSLTFLIALIGVPLYGYLYGYSAAHLVATVLALGFAGMSITVGYHRLWAHKTFEAHPILQFFLALGGAFALQNSALHWSSDHRVQQKLVDQNDKDPYSAKKVFWYSHIGWMLREDQRETYDDYSNCRDLQKNKIVMWQHKHYLSLVLITNFGVPLALGFIFNDILGMLLTVGVLRIVLSHHFTFFINSLAHIWGSQPYTDENTARDNAFFAFLTHGEGYHNYHHSFAADYRNGIRWYHFDPSKWVIWTANKLGMTKKLRTINEITVQKSLVSKDKKLILDHLSGELDDMAADFKQKLEDLSKLFDEKASAVMLKARELKQANAEQKKRIEAELKQLRSSLKSTWNEWLELTRMAVKTYELAH